MSGQFRQEWLFWCLVCFVLLDVAGIAFCLGDVCLGGKHGKIVFS